MAISYTLDEFKAQVTNLDFQRTNLFSCVFATAPSSKSQQLLDQFGGMLYSNIPVGVTDFIGLKPGEVTSAVTALAVSGTQQLVRKSGINKFLLGAMTNRVIQSLLGEFTVGTYLLDFFNMAFPTSGLTIYSVKLPENRISYEMDKNHNAPVVKLTGRDYDPLILSFRMDSDAMNYRAMQDWVNAVEDPVTGLRALPQDVECDIQVNLHNRRGIPHTVVMLQGCIPVTVSAPNLTYDGQSEIAVFDVTFAYRVMHTGAVGEQAALEWLEDKAVDKIDGISDQSLGSQLPRLSRVAGASGGLGRLTGTGRII
ncbi:tail tube baseplate junction protein [Serratia phage Muldoon]|uniref:Tail tube baseplate junction protein n=1 Tax=Serratia phage Muldoon TaxID=2601678 RepID=A0A5P8PHG3_9CAUD|nr:tail tube [Serratia phage Muldoon]QFR56152.1 tail tube baseplate junction protein [Serratia phage Muldoon]